MPSDRAVVRPRREAVAEDPSLRRELTGWVALAVSALGVAGLFAFLLALSRVPGIESVFSWPVGFFHKGLVIHVVFSFVIWFLAVFGALSLVASARLAGSRTRRLDGLGLLGLAATAAAFPLLFIPALLDRGTPTLNNYVPVIIDPLYYSGLIALAVGIGCAALRLLLNVEIKALRDDGIAAAIAAAAVVFLIALLCFAMAWRLLEGGAASHDFNEALMWGGGHLLQFANTLLLVAAWGLLAGPLVSSLSSSALALASGMLLLGALPAPAFYGLFDPFSAEQTHAFTWLQYVLGPAAAVMAAGIVGRLRRPWPWSQPDFLAMALSMLLFAIGGAFGLFVDGTDTRTPAHYHGVIAAVTVAFFGLFFTRFLPLLGRPAVRARRVRLIMHLFAWGQLAACIGLFIAGGHGTPRKVAGDAQGLADFGAMFGMGLNGFGGLIAVLGGVLFVWTVASTLLRGAPKNNPLASSELRL
jgi:cytochrome c oxidase subunit I